MPKTGHCARAIIVCTIVLVCVGLVILSSAGVIEGQKRFHSAYYYVFHQILYGVLPGLLLFYIFSRIPYQIWKKAALPILLIAIAGLVLVFMPYLGVTLKGAHRWILFYGVQIQPSEFLKFALIVYLAAWFASKEKLIDNISYAVIPLIIILSFITLLLLLQPDIGTLGIIISIVLSVYFFAGAKLSHFATLVFVFLALMVLLGFLAPYRYDRIKAFISPSEDKQGVSYHINQALVAIGSGGVFGLGFGQSQQKKDYLPEPVGDSIFAIFVEEMGFVGACFLLGIFMSLLTYMTIVAFKTPDIFGRLLILGSAIWIFGQVFINIAAITGLIPLTGLPLPFISFGSSSLVTILSALGICTNVARNV